MVRTYKKVFSLFLTLCLCLSLVIGTSSLTFADEEEVKTVTITALPEFQVGASVADTQITTEPVEGVNVKTVWTIYKPGFDPEDEYTAWFPLKDDYLAAHPTFQSDMVYKLSIEFDQYVEVAFSDNLNAWEGAELWSDGEVYFVEFGRYSDTTEIAKVVVNAPEPAVGETAAVESVKFYDTAGNELAESAATTNVRWIDYTEDYEEIPLAGQAYEAEKEYFLAVDLVAATGYTFAQKLTLVTPGHEQDFEDNDPKTFETIDTYSLYSPLENIKIQGMESLEVGSKMPTELEAVGGSEYQSLSIDWYIASEEYDDEWDSVATDETFQSGKRYKAVITYYSGYQPMPEDFYFILGDKEYTPTEIYPEYNQAVLEYDVDFTADVPTDDETDLEDEILGATPDEEEPANPPNEDAVENAVEDEAEKAPSTSDINDILPLVIFITAGSALIALYCTKKNI